MAIFLIEKFGRLHDGSSLVRGNGCAASSCALVFVYFGLHVCVSFKRCPAYSLSNHYQRCILPLDVLIQEV